MREIAEFDQEFLTEGSGMVENEFLEEKMQENLTPEEQRFMDEASPIVSQFMSLLQKAVKGEIPEDMEKTSDINPRGVQLNGMSGMEVPQNTQTQQEAPLQPVQEKTPKAALGKDQQNTPEQEAGQVAAAPVGLVNKEGADESGVADDVPTESDGFVINAAAVRKVGIRKIYDLIEEAVTYLEEKGVNLDTAKVPMDAEKILVSKGEVVIPDVIASVIGYDKLEEINSLGIDETEQIIAEQPEEKQKLPPIVQANKGENIQNKIQENTAPHDGSRIRLLPAEEDPERENQMDLMQRQIEKNKPKEPLPKTNYVPEDNVKAPDFVPMELGDRPTPVVTYFGYTPDKLYDAISKYEWRGDTPKFGFVKVGEGFSSAGKSSAFGPVQIVKRTLTDPEFVKRLSQAEQNFVDVITASQTLNINLQTFKGSASRSVSTRESPKGREALEILKITPQEFIGYVKDGYFLPSNKTKQEVGIPPELLPENYEAMYKEIYKKVLELKSERAKSGTLKGLLGEYYGHESDIEKENYANSIVESLEK